MLATPAELGEALAASWSAPLTPLSESRGYLVLACSTEQIHRSKRLIAQAIGQAAAVNRTFVEPGFAASFLVEPWASGVAVCGTPAVGGARMYWDMPRLQRAARALGTEIVGLDALRARVAALLGGGAPPPGFDRVLDVLPCRTDLAVCTQEGGKGLVEKPVQAYREALRAQLQSRHSRAYVVVLYSFNQDPRADWAADHWFRPPPLLRAAAGQALCAFGLDECACAGARCAGEAAGGGGFVAVQWRAEGALAFGVPGGLEACAALLGDAADAAAAELAAARGRAPAARRVVFPEGGGGDAGESGGGGGGVAGAAAAAPAAAAARGAPVFLLSDLLAGTSSTFPAAPAVAAARQRVARQLQRRFDAAGRLAELRAWLAAVGAAVDAGVRAQLELALAARAARLVADVRPYGSQVPQCPPASARLAPCACSAAAGSAYVAALGEYLLAERDAAADELQPAAAAAAAAAPPPPAAPASALTAGLISWLPPVELAGIAEAAAAKAAAEAEANAQVAAEVLAAASARPAHGGRGGDGDGGGGRGGGRGRGGARPKKTKKRRKSAPKAEL